MLKKLSAIIIILFCVSCTVPNDTQTPTVQPLATLHIPPTVATNVASDVAITPTLISTVKQAPTQTFIPMPTYAPTPTPITPSASIIEVTPLGGSAGWVYSKIETLTGIYRPYNTQNVRWGPGLDYAVRYRLSAGQTVEVYAWVSSLPFEAWLCLDEPVSSGVGTLCNEAVVLVYDGREYGDITIND